MTVTPSPPGLPTLPEPPTAPRRADADSAPAFSRGVPQDVPKDIPKGAPTDVPREARHEDLVRYLEDRFACVQACDDCVRVCAVRQGPADPGATPRLNSACADVCDATSRVLAEQSDQDEERVRMQVEWCRAICLQCASLCDLGSAADGCAQACRRCAKACADFLTTLG
ncbi:ferredoxin [Streptomyces formicae]|uniref:Ferredoxin n=1 Tax=Streptomyces formicae TaxID=1616117 RepID=A0A291QMI2_9ACTN|nr:ferredoxin [Streptomyces formicae]ATL32673.1 Ferredoxin [Streptomyces formicae]